MIKEIRYSGYTAIPSDYLSQDSDLSLSLNLINEDGTIAPLPSPVEAITLPDNVCGYPGPFSWHCIHDIPSSQRKNYIFSSPSDTQGQVHLFSYDALTSSCAYIGDYPRPKSITPFGNLLALCFGSESLRPLYFIKWEGEGYRDLGERPPVLSLEFLLASKPYGVWEEKTITPHFPEPSFGICHFFDPASYSSSAAAGEPITDSEKKILNDACHAVINQNIAEASKHGYLCFPFFIRVAYRLYDGTNVWHSAPMLMIPSTDSPSIIPMNMEVKDDAHLMTVSLSANQPRCLNPCNILHRILPHPGDFQDWKDIVTHIDVFISQPVYPYNVDADVYAKTPDSNKHFGNYRNTFGGGNEAGDHPFVYDGHFIKFERKSYEDTLDDKLRRVSAFYRIASIPIEDVKESSDFTPLDLEHQDLTNLVTFPTLADNDFRANDTLSPDLVTSYNNRLHISSVTNVPMIPYAPRTFIPHSDPKDPVLYQTTVHVLLKKNGQTIKTSLTGDDLSCTLPFIGGIAVPRFLYYPDPDAYMIIIGQNGVWFHFPLKRHDFLAGAYWLDPDMVPSQCQIMDSAYPQLPASAESHYQLIGNIYVSRVNNPFYFPPSSSLQVSANSILAITSATKALSQGQFGQFPLYAFTDQGVWAMEVDAQGTYSARQPITRDVCIDPEGITQIDSAVLFPTARGIMLISGSQTQCISDPINTSKPFDPVSTLPGFEKLAKLAGLDDTAPVTLLPFLSFIRDCRMIYDYVHQRIVVYNPTCRYAYLFSLRSKLWSMMVSDIQGHLNSYPEALAITSSGSLVNLSADPVPGKSRLAGEEARPAPSELPASWFCAGTSVPEKSGPAGLLLTRPLKLDAPDILKTIDTIIQRGQFSPGSIQSVLYGSRDLIHWHLIASSRNHTLRGFRGTPYKYFRIALLCRLAPGETLAGCSLSFTPRQTNRLR